MDKMDKMHTGPMKMPQAMTSGGFIGPMQKSHSDMLSKLSEQEAKFSSLKQQALNLGHSESVATEFANKLMDSGSKTKGMFKSLGGDIEEVSSLLGSVGGEMGEVGGKLSQVGNVMHAFAGKAGMAKLGILGVAKLPVLLHSVRLSRWA